MKETVLQLKELLGDDFSALVEAFDVDNRKHLDNIAACLKEDDAATIVREAHSIKGASSNLGAVDLTALCQTLESNAKDNNLADGPELLDNIREEFEKAIVVLKSV